MPYDVESPNARGDERTYVILPKLGMRWNGYGLVSVVSNNVLFKSTTSVGITLRFLESPRHSSLLIIGRPCNVYSAPSLVRAPSLSVASADHSDDDLAIKLRTRTVDEAAYYECKGGKTSRSPWSCKRVVGWMLSFIASMSTKATTINLVGTKHGRS